MEDQMMDKSRWPEWLKEARTKNADVEIDKNGRVIWKDGIWEGGTWEDGTWIDGTWKDGTWKCGTWEAGFWTHGTWKGGFWKCGVWEGGTWKRGTWRDGVWKRGTWKGGIWEGGTWEHGVWEGGTWKGGTWEDGTWEDGVWEGGTWIHGTWKGGAWEGGIWRSGAWEDKSINRKLYMLSMIGIVFEKDGTAVGYRCVDENYRGKWNEKFRQRLNKRVDVKCSRASGTCLKGLHITNPHIAYHYFDPEPGDRLIKVTFNEDDLLDCDGEKARIKGGYCEEVEWPWKERKKC